MCDTFWSTSPRFAGTGSLFAKNSDRHPDEPQYLVYEAPRFDGADGWERLDKYKVQRRTLELAAGDFSFRYGALVSRPSWMWGAEMGINERGVAIGNEAVFSKGPSAKDGLLGMDILRLALHGAGGAAEGAVLIGELVKRWGQGGDGGYRSSLFYSNAFLVADASAAYRVETCGRRAEIVRVLDREAISNAYVRTDMPEQILVRAVAQGRARRKLCLSALDAPVSEGTGLPAPGPGRAFSTLRLHRGGASSPVKGMDSICMHSGSLIASGTTASLVVQWPHPQGSGEGDEKTTSSALVWATESPHPCVSLFYPVWAIGLEEPSEGLKDRMAAAERYRYRRSKASAATRVSRLFSQDRRSERDRLENEALEALASANDGAATREALVKIREGAEAWHRA